MCVPPVRFFASRILEGGRAAIARGKVGVEPGPFMPRRWLRSVQSFLLISCFAERREGYWYTTLQSHQTLRACLTPNWPDTTSNDET